MMLIGLNIFANRNIIFVFMSIIFLCLSCSDLNNFADDKSLTDLESESKTKPNLVVADTVVKNSTSNLSVKNILSEATSEYTITSGLCDNEEGPNCIKLRLGDEYFTTSTPAKDYLYSCIGKNPNAPGSIESRITWIDFTNKTWNFFKKLWLPTGTFNPGPGTYKEIFTDNNRQIDINNLPVDGKIGDWPMSDYPILTEIDRNPGIPTSNTSSFTYPANPSVSSSPT